MFPYFSFSPRMYDMACLCDVLSERNKMRTCFTFVIYGFCVIKCNPIFILWNNLLVTTKTSVSNVVIQIANMYACIPWGQHSGHKSKEFLFGSLVSCWRPPTKLRCDNDKICLEYHTSGWIKPKWKMRWLSDNVIVMNKLSHFIFVVLFLCVIGRLDVKCGIVCRRNHNRYRNRILRIMKSPVMHVWI